MQAYLDASGKVDVARVYEQVAMKGRGTVDLRNPVEAQGLRNLDEGYIPPVFENWHGGDLLDRKRVVRPRESIEWTRRLVEHGVFAGLSAGAAMAGAVKVAAEIDRGAIVFIVSDGGWKYLSTGAYTADLDTAEAAAEQVIYF